MARELVRVVIPAMVEPASPEIESSEFEIPAIDVLGLGAVAVDDLIYVESYPPADAKTAVLRTDRQCGGLSATALVAAARLGARAAYAGQLGSDELSRFVIDRMTAENVSLSQLRRVDGARPLHSFIVVDSQRQTRNIFCDHNGALGAAEDWPPNKIVQSARVLFVDHFGVPGMIRAARLARAAGRPVVGDLERESEPRFSELLELVDHLIVSEPFAKEFTGKESAAESVLALWNSDRALVAVTCGAEGCWFCSREAPQPIHQPAFRVSVVDTTGCGDVFHGAYAAALAWGMEARARIRFATAAAGLKATQRGGQLGIPRKPDVEKFLAAHPLGQE